MAGAPLAGRRGVGAARPRLVRRSEPLARRRVRDVQRVSPQPEPGLAARARPAGRAAATPVRRSRSARHAAGDGPLSAAAIAGLSGRGRRDPAPGSRPAAARDLAARVRRRNGDAVAAPRGRAGFLNMRWTAPAPDRLAAGAALAVQALMFVENFPFPWGPLLAVPALVLPWTPGAWRSPVVWGLIALADAVPLVTRPLFVPNHHFLMTYVALAFCLAGAGEERAR